MNRPAAALVLSILVASVTLAQEADPAARAAIDEAEALIAEGDFLAANAKLAPLRGQPMSKAIKDALFLTRCHLALRAAERYAAGEDIGLMTHEQVERQAMVEFSPRAAATQLLIGMLAGLRRLPADVHELVLADEALRGLHDVPEFRMIRWSDWRQPRREVWPDAKVESGDAAYDSLFRQLADLPMPEAEYDAEPVDEYAHRESEFRTPGAAWAFRFRCALLNPVRHGGWPTRLSLLQDPRAVRAALTELRAAGEPTGIAAAYQVNLAIAAGEREPALALLRALRTSDPFLYDVTVHHAQQLAVRRLLADRENQDLRAFSAELDALACGLAPAEAR